MSPRTTVAAVTVAVTAALLLVGCSSSTPDPEVATLQTAPPSRVPDAPGSGAPDDARPRERLDMNASDLTVLYAEYDACMAQHDVSGLDENAHGNIGPGAAIPDDALTACAPIKPLPAWEKDRTNPLALDFAEKVIDCLRGKGVKYVELYNDPANPIVGEVFGGPTHDVQSNVLGQKYQPICEQEVYRAQK
ncbi:MAG: hypothetical protein ABWX66_04145 [Lacisediminihabitans sp.]